MKSILLVEDEELLCEIVAESLQLSNAENVVHSVGDGARALELLKGRRFDLVITDLRLPEVDGLTLLSYMHEHRISTPVIVITGQESVGVEPLARSLGARVFFQKPFDLDVLLVTAERYLLAAEPTAGNRIQGFTLPSFLQLMEIDGKSSAVRVLSTGNREGELRFFDGKLVSASTPTLRGDEAAMEILQWPAPEIRITDSRDPWEPNVQRSLTSLLLHCCQQQDEGSTG